MTSASSSARLKAPVRRSALLSRLRDTGVEFETLGNTLIPIRVAKLPPLDPTREIGLFDLSHAARFGLKGPGAADWLDAQGITLPVDLHAYSLARGIIAARVASEEYLLLGEPWAETPAITSLQATWESREAAGARSSQLTPVAWSSSHAWLCLLGESAWRLMRYLCAVDLRPEKTHAKPLLMTSMANGVSVTILAQSIGAVPALNLLVDRGYASYLWDMLFAVADHSGLRVAARSDWPVQARAVNRSE